MSKNICVLTGARDSGMCKICGYLRENGVNITGFHERCDLMDDSEAIMSEGDSVITKKDTTNKVIMLTTKQTEELTEKAKEKGLTVVQLIIQSPKYSLGRIVNMLPIYGNEGEAEISEYIRKIAGKPDTYIINVDRNADSTCKYVLDMVKNIIINFKPGNPIPLGAGRKGSFFYKKIKKISYFFYSLLKNPAY